HKRKGKKRRALKEREEQAGSGSEAEEESEAENEVADVADDASSSGSSVVIEEDVSDFKWVLKNGKRTPTRDKSIPLTPDRTRAWQEFVSSQSTSKKRKSKPKADPGRAVFES